MNVLIVYAHPEPKSFNAALKDLAVATLTGQGHHVQVSDLYAMQFNPVAGRHDFQDAADPGYFIYQLEQQQAAAEGTFAPDVAAEVERLQWADLVIFQFPLWWFGLPAILKGWVDRIFAMGVAYPGSYQLGLLKGKRAMLSLTTGGPERAFQPEVRSGELDMLLFPVQHGMLYFAGMDVLPPFVAFSPGRVTAEERAQYLEQYQERLRTLASTEPLHFTYPAPPAP